MRNKIYNWFWFKIFTKLIPVDSTKTGPARSHKRNVWQLRLSKLFGGAKGIILGDSESATFNTYKTMSKFSGLVLNMGFGGSRPIDWIEYLNGIGDSIYKQIGILGKIKKIWSIGGNCSLWSCMDEIPETLKDLHYLFPDSWIMLIPPVHAGMLAAAGTKTRDQWLNEMALIRAYQESIFNPLVIDTYTPFLDKETGEAIILYLKDPVHFYDISVGLLEKIFNQIT
jgi:hypothetical protein